MGRPSKEWPVGTVRDGIRKVAMRDGTIRYRIVTEAGISPETGRRRQLTQTFDTATAARDELNRIRGERATGKYVPPAKLTVNELLDSHLNSETYARPAATAQSYRLALLPARKRLGDRLVKDIQRGDIEALRDWMESAGRKCGGEAGTGLGARSVRLTIGRLSAAFERAVDDGVLARNPCRRVRLPVIPPSSKRAWSEDEVARFLAGAASRRLYAVWLAAVTCGLRREELCGARWADIDLDAGTWSVSAVRVLVGGQVHDQDRPKSARSERTVPLPPEVVDALRQMHKRQVGEKLAAGPAYEGGGFVVADELGAPVMPDWLSRDLQRVIRAVRAAEEAAGVDESDRLPRLSLHELRHTANSIAEKRGVPDSVRAAYFGHAIEVNRAVYTHAHESDLHAVADALGAAIRKTS